jgi:hypothetical protein
MTERLPTLCGIPVLTAVCITIHSYIPCWARWTHSTPLYPMLIWSSVTIVNLLYPQDLRSSGMLEITDVSGRRIASIFKCQAVLYGLTLEDETKGSTETSVTNTNLRSVTSKKSEDIIYVHRGGSFKSCYCSLLLWILSTFWGITM